MDLQENTAYEVDLQEHCIWVDLQGHCTGVDLQENTALDRVDLQKAIALVG